MSNFEIKPGELEKLRDETTKKLDQTNETMRLVVIVLLVMVGGMVLTTSLWVVQAFLSTKKPQINYDISISADQLIPLKK